MAGKRRSGTLLRKTYPILEFDGARRAVINPTNASGTRAPAHCILCFFREVTDSLRAAAGTEEITRLKSEAWAEPLLRIAVSARSLAVLHPGVGAPLAAAFLEELIALGCRKFIACGSAGVLDSNIARGHIVVPTAAVRDEGTSYHYLAPGREIEPSRRGVNAICRVLSSHGIPFVRGKTWTTDAFYRETHAKVALRRAEGCITAEMEAAAFFAVAKFRRVTFAQMLYGGDDISGLEWDPRQWDARTPARERLFWLAVEACLLL